MIRGAVALLVLEAIGAATLTLLCSDLARWTMAACLGLSFGLGLIVSTVWLGLASYAGFVPAGWLGLIELLLLTAGAALVRRGSARRWLTRAAMESSAARRPWQRPLDGILLALVVGLGLLVGAVAVAEPLVEWDQLAIWGLKARVLLHDPLGASPYFRDLALAYSHLDYPLLWPLAMAWVWAWAGHADLDAVKVLAPALLAAFAATCFGLLRRRHERTTALVFTALLVGLPMILSQTSRLAADAPFAFFAMVAFYGWYLWLVEEDVDALRLSGVFAAGMVLTKNEGLGWLAILIVLAGATLAVRRTVRPLARVAAWTVLAPLVITGAWLAFRATIPKVHEDYGSRLGPLAFLDGLGRVPEILGRAPTYFAGVTDWLGFWPLLAAALALGVRGWWRRPPLFLVLAVILPMLMYGYIYVVSPWKVEELMDATANRLLLHAAPLSVLLLVEIVGGPRFLPGRPPARAADAPAGRRA